MNQELFSIEEFCNRVGISRSTFYRNVGSGFLHTYKSGHRTLIHRNEIKRWFLTRKPRKAKARHPHRASRFSKFIKFIFGNRH